MRTASRRRRDGPHLPRGRGYPRGSSLPPSRHTAQESLHAHPTTRRGLGLLLAGIDLWIDAAGLIGGFAVGTDGLGVARLPLPIPSSAPAGFTLAAQFGVLDPCGPMGLTATDAVGVATLP